MVHQTLGRFAQKESHREQSRSKQTAAFSKAADPEHIFLNPEADVGQLLGLAVPAGSSALTSSTSGGQPMSAMAVESFRLLPPL